MSAAVGLPLAEAQPPPGDADSQPSAPPALNSGDIDSTIDPEATPQNERGEGKQSQSLAPSSPSVSWSTGTRFSPAASLEAHGYKAIRELTAGASNANVLLVCRWNDNPDEVKDKFVVKTFALGSLDAKGKRSVLQEIALLKRLKHHNVISYVESWWTGVGPLSGRLTVVMEFAEDGDLRSPIKGADLLGKKIEEPVIKLWLCQLLTGLAYVHSQNIIHRDLKAMNVFLKRSWTHLVIGDFGISTMLDNSNDVVSGCVGTPAYMAPELVWNERYSNAVDLWAVGVMLFELMALTLPFNAGNLLALVYQIAFNTYDETPIKDAGYSEALLAVVTGLLSKDPTERPAAVDLLSGSAGTEVWKGYSEDDSQGRVKQVFAQVQATRTSSSSTPSDDVFCLSKTDPEKVVGAGRSSMMDSDIWASAFRLSIDSITGERVEHHLSAAENGKDAVITSAVLSPTSATLVEAAMTAGTVPDERIWDELRKTQDGSDFVPAGRFDAILASLNYTVKDSKGSVTKEEAPASPIAELNAASSSLTSTETPSCTLPAPTDLPPVESPAPACTARVADIALPQDDVDPQGPEHDEFEVLLEKRRGAILGARVIGDASGNHVLIQKVLPGGLMDEWNVDCKEESQKILRGDLVVEVNGVRDSSGAILNKLARSVTLKMTIRRGWGPMPLSPT
eukprot:TRINITY_DN58740_c0_g1_i1.p1 TRINITY_DN58740_c0_g1~~TRINITY_DN58740_c0_g1_i1.p1  ORF type:complete len:699 (-),score=116.07 TRINITY_DN58740_c0_g1_i1:522-2555(-)